MQVKLGLLRGEVERGLDPVLAEQRVDALLTMVALDDPAHIELRLIRAIAMRSNGRTQEAGDELAELEANCIRQGLTRLRANIKLEQARLMFSSGKLSEALVAARTLLQSGYSSLDPILDGDARFLLGRILAMSGETWQAEAELGRALAVFEEQRDDWRRAEAQSALAMVLVRQGRNFEGIRLWHEALAYHEMEGNTAIVARELERIGYATWCAGDLEQTRRTLERVLQMREENPSEKASRSLLATHFNMAGLELLEGKHEAARFHMEKAQQLAEELGDRILYAGTKLIEAALALISDEPARARASATAALQTAGEISYTFPLCEQPIFALVHLANGDKAAAQAAWPLLPSGLDGAQHMSLRTVRTVLRALLDSAPSAEQTEMYAVWDAELDRLSEQ